MINTPQRTPQEPYRHTRPTTLAFSVRCAVTGLRTVLRRERNARFHLSAAALVIVAGAALGLSSVEWAVITLAIGGVFAAECFNTAIEAVVDLVSPQQHALAAMAKDCAAGAVLCAAVTALSVGICVVAGRLL